MTYFDLIQKEEFRDFVSKRIDNSYLEPFKFPKTLPKLYKYRPLSSYAVNDIINGRITLSSIGEFNDIFDGAMHQYGSKQEIENTAEARWKKLETIRTAAHLPEGLFKKEDLVKPYIEHLKRESRLKFRELEYLGTFVCCFSKSNTSPLMWAHYADSNKGICIEYDFNMITKGNLLKNSIFPVAYTPKPINVTDLLEDTENHISPYSLDASILCAALNKSSDWQYEQEWRLVWILPQLDNQERHLSINSLIQPSKIYLGFHFLKPFFYYDNKNKEEWEKCEDAIRKFLNLISFIKKNNIPLAIMVPSIGTYRFIQYDIPVDKLYGFMYQFFQDELPESMRYYYTVHDQLMNLIETAQEDNNA